MSLRWSVITALISVTLMSTICTARATAFIDDPLLAEQWGWYRIDADHVYESGVSGSGVIVAVIDSGVNASHPDLSGNIIEGWNYVDNNDDVSDEDGHGTMVTGARAAILTKNLFVCLATPLLRGFSSQY